MTKKGILIQGKVSGWTRDIISEYQDNFSDIQIILSTWIGENVEDINCEIIFTEPPIPTKPFDSTINHQIIGTQKGLEKMNSEIILKCRTDHFIHNEKIFEIYENSCPKEKIMIPDHGTYDSIKFRASDLCQIAKLDIMKSFWNQMPLFDGLKHIDPGVYFTKNYINKIKNDEIPWKYALRRYFYVKSYESDFQIEWEKLNKFKKYQDNFFRAYLGRVKIDQ